MHLWIDLYWTEVVIDTASTCNRQSYRLLLFFLTLSRFFIYFLERYFEFPL